MSNIKYNEVPAPQNNAQAIYAQTYAPNAGNANSGAAAPPPPAYSQPSAVPPPLAATYVTATNAASPPMAYQPVQTQSPVGQPVYASPPPGPQAQFYAGNAPPPPGYYPQLQYQQPMPPGGLPPGFEHAVSGQWKDSPFDCFSQIMPSCICAEFCPCVMMGQMGEKMGLFSCCGYVTGYTIACIILFIISVATRSGGAIWLIIWAVCFSTAIYLRTKLRELLRIPGDTCEDVALSVCCTCCTIAQLARQIYGYREPCESAVCDSTGNPPWYYQGAVYQQNPNIPPPGTRAYYPQQPQQRQYPPQQTEMAYVGASNNQAGAYAQTNPSPPVANAYYVDGATKMV